ncbi:pyridine nucleotide-disulfide oxidoreductase [Christiangramia fulva]|uniref:Pyridine nucleotide-disulfide oxidoreductase n=1 Tax=Christiangramia fulva TaxID=2126553 RepID=A0A2R3Z856_9FLAO|nr:NAD(P)/FAD-dependent oxidoreductase [Christiangramia fulva]AVR46425.1 pyridine nucleotide-disulfide oxidoreductase [Christiangramia fulva]
MKQQITDILIIGAGPGGMVAAGYLHDKEISVKVIEKQSFPRFAIGESLIPRCMDNFEEAGLLSAIDKKGYQKKFGARFIRGNETAEFNFSKKYGDGWDWTWQVPRADFDKTLADEIQKKGIDISFETEVISVEKENDDLWKVITKNKEGISNKIHSRFIIDASGNGRVLAKQFRLEAPPEIYDHSSIFTHIKETGRPKGKEGQLITFEVLDTETWFWYIPFSDGMSSIGFVAPNKWFENFEGPEEVQFKKMLEKTDYYKGRFDDHQPIFKPVKLQNISRNVSSIYGKAFALTGNAAEFLDPIFSSGVAFATESSLLAAKLALRELNGESINWEEQYKNYIQKGVNVFSVYVKEWYTGRLQRIFFYDHPNESIKEQICSVLAGYVWDTTNPFVRNAEKMLWNLDYFIDFEKNKKNNVSS